jgi:hypothetical protein
VRFDLGRLKPPGCDCEWCCGCGLVRNACVDEALTLLSVSDKTAEVEEGEFPMAANASAMVM